MYCEEKPKGCLEYQDFKLFAEYISETTDITNSTDKSLVESKFDNQGEVYAVFLEGVARGRQLFVDSLNRAKHFDNEESLSDSYININRLLNNAVTTAIEIAGRDRFNSEINVKFVQERVEAILVLAEQISKTYFDLATENQQVC